MIRGDEVDFKRYIDIFNIDVDIFLILIYEIFEFLGDDVLEFEEEYGFYIEED